MDRQRTIVVGLLLASSLVLTSCEKKKPPVPPPQAQAPTITDTTGVPAAIPEVAVPQPPQPEPTAPAPAVAKPKKKPKVAKTETKKTAPPPAQAPSTPAPSAQTSAENKPDKVVIVEGGKSDPNPPPLVADTANEQAARERLSTAQLINAAETNIRNVTRQLSSDEMEKVQHIRGFIEQSKEAAKAGDTTMAYNLAVKAKLMSDTLVRP